MEFLVRQVMIIENFLLHPVLHTPARGYLRSTSTMGKGAKTASKNAKSAGKTARLNKATPAARQSLLKTKLKHRAKNTRAQIEKINKDTTEFLAVHSELTKPKAKEVKVLDAQLLREDFQRDESARAKSAQADKDLKSQLELLSVMNL